MPCFPLETLEGKAGRCSTSHLYMRCPPSAQATSMESIAAIAGGYGGSEESWGGSEPPAPSFNPTYWRSHESRRASGTWVPLGKEKGALRRFDSALTQLTLHPTLLLISIPRICWKP